DVFSYLSAETQVVIISAITERETRLIVEELYFDDMIDMLEEMPAHLVKKILKDTKEDERRLINQFLSYPEFSAGSLMTIEYVDLRKNMTVKAAMEHIKQVNIDTETIYTCYVIDDNRKLLGLVSLRKIVTSPDDVLIDDIMNTNIIVANTLDDQEYVASLFKKYDLNILPVTDKESRLTGIITIDDIIDVIDQENTEDFQKMAGLTPSDLGYFETPFMKMAKNRILWLMVLMVSATFTGRIIQRYEEVLQSVVILAAFIPMLMDTGGNAGAQSSTLVIRGLALGDIKPNEVKRVLFKELTVSTVVAIGLTTINFIRIYFLEKVEIRIALTVTITLFVTIILAKLVGGLLPLIANKLKLDPAIMASPLITTVVDAFALVIYFTVAVWLLGI
ncbi:MAG TPA: magnesium transporter, partial [Clostridiales bacterium UBA8960]|nr:magnesium transporter [Clostridiales bacterium UBA8960]